MFGNEIELLQETYYSIKHNQRRSFLSGFGIAWGILLLAILLGVGSGFQAGIMGLFQSFAQKSLYVYAGTTSQKYESFKEGRRITFSEDFIKTLRLKYTEIDAISPEISTSIPVRNNARDGVFRVTGINADYMHIRILEVGDSGRILTKADIQQTRPVAIVGENVKSILFGEKEALEKYINISGMLYKIVGILKNDNIFSASEINSIYIPVSCFLRNVASDNQFTSFSLYLKQNANASKFENNLRNYMAHYFRFKVKDEQAVYIANLEKQTSTFESFFNWLQGFIWFIGVCFLTSGMVGVSNIMYTVVKERTNEIGIRLAVGATPHSIIRLILLESVLITVISGIVGLIIGKSILLFIDWLLSMHENILMHKTELNMQTALAALSILVLSGIIAGLFPAIKASSIEPADAIRYENRG
ncbi:ABC transporter permease [Bacteroides sp. AN502(2024)]|uniref:ABC transporter permease n=1 Tax=Bacteroides sp. AN502(2024) TaxID=3160599 RepID=UPI003516F7C9